MRKISLFALFTAVIVTMISCCPCRKKSKNPMHLSSAEWTLIEMNSNQAITKEDNNSFVIRFDDVEKQITGTAQCNNFFGGYEVLPQNKIRFGAMGATKAMCPNIEIEDEFLRTIAEVDSFTIDGDVLLLQKNGNVVMIFQALPAVK